MMRLELEVSVPGDMDPLGLAAVVSQALMEPLGSRGARVHRITAEEGDA